MTNKIIANEEIKSSKVFLIGADGVKVGETPTSEALRLAVDAGVDLVVISTNKDLPVAKIIDRNKYIYEMKQKEKQQKKNNRTPEMKEIRISPNIADNDLNTKKNAARKFLDKGHELKLSLICRGREVTRIVTISSILDEVTKDLEDCAVIKVPKKIEGRMATTILRPKK